MKEKLTIALVAHDNRKADMVDWARYNAEYLSHHRIVCTGTTGGLIKNAFDELGIEADIRCMNSGPLGGDAEIAAMVVRHEVDLAVFLIDDLNPQPHEACNRISADLMISSSLWSDDTYVPAKQSYVHFDRKPQE